jgi:hypothetical protein
MQCSMAIKPPRSSIASSHGSWSSKRKCSLHHVVSCL